MKYHAKPVRGITSSFTLMRRRLLLKYTIVSFEMTLNIVVRFCYRQKFIKAEIMGSGIPELKNSY